MIVSKKIADYFEDNLLACSLIYSGHPLGCAAGVACLEYCKEQNILGNVEYVGLELGSILEELKRKHECVGDVRYIGITHENVIIIAPPLIITKEQLDEVLSVVDEIFL